MSFITSDFSEQLEWVPIRDVNVGTVLLLNQYSSFMQVYKVLPRSGQTEMQLFDQWDYERKHRIFNNNTKVLALKASFLRNVRAEQVGVDQTLVWHNTVARVKRTDRMLDSGNLSVSITLTDVGTGKQITVLHKAANDYISRLIPLASVPDCFVPVTEIREGQTIRMPFEDKRIWDKRHRSGRQTREFITGKIAKISQPNGRFKKCIRVVSFAEDKNFWLFGDSHVELLDASALPPIRKPETPGHTKVEMWV